ncbi:hypothetical protein CABS01_10851 [Colletotrichum abscissum]|uniref:Uncharacterized protein n=1 Tax=Colletotrichum abscissum TaxID=1671311 RepID=A0A9P9XNQ5_9PEZI|nr:uncharacterized protein CABS01_10851 [Colletotrichum abscissum]KAI3557303.1 hypothetical protein CABS02_02407 [Colletotrichum abscissum]KAK1497873.1 hypothetical protein CABS01_10851 [Colletotrichum abscissum]
MRLLAFCFLVSSGILLARGQHESLLTKAPPVTSEATAEQQSAAADMADTIEYDFVPVYMLTKLINQEEKAFTSAISALEEVVAEEDDYLRPKLVHWTSDVDGAVEKDLLPMNKKLELETTLESESNFFFYADRRSVEDGGTIVAGHDWGTLCISRRANQRFTKFCQERGISLPTGGWKSMDAIIVQLTEEIITWGVTWGRQPGPSWKSAYQNLDLNNMQMSELIGMHDEEINVQEDSDWDAQTFEKRLREELDKIKDEL